MAVSSRDTGGKDRLDDLEDRLETFIESLRAVGVVAGDFQPEGQTVLNTRINSVVENMRLLDREKETYADIKIPLQVLNYVDEGKNPQLFTKDQLEKTLDDHKAVQKKVEAYKQFRDELVQQLQPNFPNEIKAYLSHCGKNH